MVVKRYNFSIYTEVAYRKGHIEVLHSYGFFLNMKI